MLEAPRLTAEEFGRMTDDGGPTELVRGRVERQPVLIPAVGNFYSQAAGLLSEWVRARNLGRVVIGSGLILGRGPDTVRGYDVHYYSFARFAGPFPDDRYLDVPPDMVLTVRRPTDRWAYTLRRAADYLGGGAVVLVFDPPTNSAYVYRAEQKPQTFGPDDTLTLPDVLPGFELVVRRVFE